MYVGLGSEGSKMTQNFVKSSVFSSFEQVNRLESQKSVSNALESGEDKVILAGSEFLQSAICNLPSLCPKMKNRMEVNL